METMRGTELKTKQHFCVELPNVDGVPLTVPCISERMDTGVIVTIPPNGCRWDNGENLPLGPMEIAVCLSIASEYNKDVAANKEHVSVHFQDAPDNWANIREYIKRNEDILPPNLRISCRSIRVHANWEQMCLVDIIPIAKDINAICTASPDLRLIIAGTSKQGNMPAIVDAVRAIQ